MSFEQGLSGLNAASSSLGAIGNNVANASTVGFKQSSAQFADMFAASLSGASSTSIGTGVRVAGVAQEFTQGNITTTTNPLDTAISGPGFFQLTNSAGATVYSRNGQFQLDKSGYMVNAQGDKVNGYMPNAAGVILGGAAVPILINPANIQPNASATATVGVNLSSAAPVPTTAAFSPTDPTSYTNSTSMTVYDSLGASHVGTVYFARQPVFGGASSGAIPTISSSTTTSATLSSTAGLSVGNTITFATPTPAQTATITGINTTTGVVTLSGLTVAPLTIASTNAPSSSWNTYLTVDGNLVPATPTTPLAQLTFNDLGSLTATTPASTPLGTVPSSALFPNSTSVSTTQTVAFNFNSPTAATTQYGSPFAVNTLTQDGYASGQLNSTSTSPDGTIMGRYSNGQTRSLGQIVLANFTGVQGLQDIGNNSWVQTAASGNPLVGTPGAGGLGVLQSSATEDSNVDLTAALVNMITAQRVYQANAQTIKTEDSLMQTVVNLR